MKIPKSDKYTCHKCGSTHCTDNMVAYCAVCYSEAKREAVELEKKLAEKQRAYKHRIQMLVLALRRAKKKFITHLLGRAQECRRAELAEKMLAHSCDGKYHPPCSWEHRAKQAEAQLAEKEKEIAEFKQDLEGCLLDIASDDVELDFFEKELSAKEKEIALLQGFLREEKEQNEKALEKIAAKEKEIETLILQLASCGVAAMGNTEETKAKRIGKDNPYWSASYGDVCMAVDREMKLRTELAAKDALIQNMRDALENSRRFINEKLPDWETKVIDDALSPEVP